MGLSNSRPASKKNLIIHIKKCIIKDNVIYLFDKDHVAQVIAEKVIAIKKIDPKESLEESL